MTPKEKANDLFYKLYIICQEYTEEIQCSIQAKKCALVAVDEIVQQNNIWINHTSMGTNNYWEEVKQEIEKL